MLVCVESYDVEAYRDASRHAYSIGIFHNDRLQSVLTPQLTARAHAIASVLVVEVCENLIVCVCVCGWVGILEVREMCVSVCVCVCSTTTYTHTHTYTHTGTLHHRPDQDPKAHV